MKYTSDNILTLLQDIQRHIFGKVTMFINAYAPTDDCVEIGRQINVCVFDINDKARCFTFSDYNTEEQNRDLFLSMKEVIKEFGL